MEENQKPEVNQEEIKKETKETVSQVKETMKNVDIKNDAKEAKGFAQNLFQDPVGTIKNIVNDDKNKQLKTAILLIIVWVVVAFVKSLSLKHWSLNSLFNNTISLTKSMITPVLEVLIMSFILYIFNKDNKKSLPTIITAVTTANIPVIAAKVISLLTIISSRASMLTSPITAFASVISLILTYYVAKAIYNEEDDAKFVKKFVMIEGVYYIAYFVLSFLGLYI